MVAVSIRSPHRSEGRHFALFSRASHYRVSIRSPHRSEGRQTNQRLYVRDDGVSIRSPHRSEGRPARRVHYVSCCVVSIRSPHRSEGRLRVYLSLRTLGAVSIRSPHRSEGRHPARPLHRPRRLRFNPLPSPKRGETSLPPGQVVELNPFQSAPLTEARGDRIGIHAWASAVGSFNPLPSPKRGETCSNVSNNQK